MATTSTTPDTADQAGYVQPATPTTTQQPASAHAQPRRTTGLRQFRLLRVLRQGRSDTVFEAIDLATQMPIAVTLAQPAITTIESRSEAWAQTARRLAGVSHPALRRPRRIARHGGRPFCINDLPKGQTVSDHVRHRPMEARKALETTAVLADALAALHATGLVHGRIRPNCVFINDAGQPILDALDFDQTYTPGVSVEEDLAALRALTFEMITGRHPVADSTLPTDRSVRDRLDEVNRWIPHLHQNIRQWCASVLGPSQPGRSRTATQLATELRGLAASTAKRTTSHTQVEWFRKTMLRHRVSLAGTAAVLLGVIGGLIFAAMRPGTLELTVEPAYASVQVGGRSHPVHKGRATVKLAGGSHWLRIDSPGWRKTAAPVHIDRGDRQQLHIRLLRETGQVRVNSQWAAQGGYLELFGPGGRLGGGTNLTRSRDLPVGHYEAWLAPANYEPQRFSFSIASDKATTLSPSARPLRRHLLPLPGHQPELAGSGRDILALVCGRRLVGVSALGKKLWTRNLPAKSGIPTLVTDLAGNGIERVIVGLNNGALLCLDALRGTPIFRKLLGGEVRGIIAKADLNGDQFKDIVAGTQGGRIFALDGRNGSILWKTRIATVGGWSDCEVSGPIRLGRITLDSVSEVVISTAKPAGIVALSGRGGKLLWKHRLDGKFDTAWQTTLVAGSDGRSERVVLISPDGRIQSRRALDGKIQWRRKNGKFSPLPALPVINAGPQKATILWTLDDGRLTGLDPVSGRVVIRPDGPNGSIEWFGPLATGDAMCVVAGTRGRVVSMSAAKTQWTFAADKPIRACRGLGRKSSIVALLCDDRAILVHPPVAPARAPLEATGKLQPSAKWRKIEAALRSDNKQ